MPKKAAVKTAKKSKQTPLTKILVAARTFGFESLRPGQREAIEALLRKQDCLVVMPTGSGKSAIYQIAGEMLNGAVLVISPLIALQKDQVDTINEQTGGEAVVVNSTQSVSEAADAFEKIENQTGKYIFLAPEQLQRDETMAALEQAGISLFVIDEAHCISEWGHDFRPDYLALAPLIERLGHPVILAMTATASPEVRDEIVQRLAMKKPNIFVHGFDRPNIFLRVDRFEAEDKKLEALIHRVRWSNKPGIVYVGTRKKAEEIMRLLDEEEISAAFYHGGLKAAQRSEIQERFMADQTSVIVATNAFGMGIDKPNVRFVYHYDVSESLDAYYQEIGRAGRDGESAEAVLFYRHEDIGSQKFKTADLTLEPEQVEHVVEAIASKDGPVDADQLLDQMKISERKLVKVIHRLEDVGALETLPTGEVSLTAERSAIPALAEAAAEEQKRRKEIKAERLRQMQEYAETGACRREFLLRYFADDFTAPCGWCDNCEKNDPGARVDPEIGTRREVA